MQTIFNIKKLFSRRKILRNHSTPQEVLLWAQLKNSKLGHKWRRQHSIGGYITDFYSPAKKLIIEIDGSGHFSKDNIELDKTRTEYFRGLGLNVLRFTNEEINNNMNGVLQKIISIVHFSPPCGGGVPKGRGGDY